ncbi:MAG: hypothetical protein R3A79_05335 [Nannocystaceae bacterium]
MVLGCPGASENGSETLVLSSSTAATETTETTLVTVTLTGVTGYGSDPSEGLSAGSESEGTTAATTTGGTTKGVSAGGTGDSDTSGTSSTGDDREEAVCGDGVVAGDEECDEGEANGDMTYGGCLVDCTLGPHCGDGAKQALELCDETAMIDDEPAVACVGCRWDAAILYVTSGVTQGAIASPDDFCADHVPPEVALLGWEVRAFIAESGGWPLDWLPGGPVVQLKGELLGSSFGKLSAVAATILDENGDEIKSGSGVWTNVTGSGGEPAAAADCKGWSFGEPPEKGHHGNVKDAKKWADTGTSYCTAQHHLYCVAFSN